ncbi:DUF885 domain-containing protein [Hymenobacter sp. HDW8]|uniref:DUF885 domain-containing protein n=1 Tax=Hymenobacter sp. HDW8 TaxID=2714932 RepID=UPI00140DF6D8|nr:DUF885 domain-containing protein [Hymenobacter sp. HDW8]QIL75543.1 DUF885 domain-containing protein [Hymenobacter sp. HDW8]
MKLPFLTALVAFALVSPAVAQKAKPVTTKPATNSRAASSSSLAPLAALFEAYSEEEARLEPFNAMQQGDNRYNDQLPNDMTQARREEVRDFYQRYLKRLGQIDRKRLGATDQTSYDILVYSLTQRLEGYAFNNWMMPFDQFGGLPTYLAVMGTGTGAQPFKTVQDYDNWLSRVGKFPVWADSAIGNFRQGIKAGVVLPKALVPKMVSQLRPLAQAGADPTKSLFFGPVKNFPASFSAADKARLTPLFEQAIRRDLAAPYQKLADFLETEYLPQARVSSGIGALPQGAARYAYAVQVNTTTTRTPEQIYQTGLAEVARIRTAMETIKKQVGFAGDLNAFFEHLRTSPQFKPFKTPEEVLAVYNGILARITPNLPKLFGRTPKAGFEVRRVEAFREASASAHYMPAAPDGSRPGIFYNPIPDATQYNVTRGMDALFLHEAIPGHHYQIALQQENTSQPRFRRFAIYSAYVEGWGLYAESLGRELGVYTDPYQQMGALNTEIHRALRLVTDVGLHTGKLTREEAIKYLMANEPIDEQRATAEVERYMAAPGQALSYKTGQLKISELRARYEKQLGPKFDLRAFHDEILAGGSMPLAVLEKTMDAWAAKQK